MIGALRANPYFFLVFRETSGHTQNWQTQELENKLHALMLRLQSRQSQQVFSLANYPVTARSLLINQWIISYCKYLFFYHIILYMCSGMCRSRKLNAYSYLLTYLLTLTLAYLYCEFAFRSHFKCVVRPYDLNYAENANKRKARFINIHMRWKR